MVLAHQKRLLRGNDFCSISGCLRGLAEVRLQRAYRVWRAVDSYQEKREACLFIQAFLRGRFYRRRGVEDLETKRRAVASITKARRVTLWHRLQDKVHKLQVRV